MTEAEIQKRRASYEKMIAMGFHEYKEALELLDIVDTQQKQIAAMRTDSKSVRTFSHKMIRPQLDK